MQNAMPAREQESKGEYVHEFRYLYLQISICLLEAIGGKRMLASLLITVCEAIF